MTKDIRYVKSKREIFDKDKLESQKKSTQLWVNIVGMYIFVFSTILIVGFLTGADIKNSDGGQLILFLWGCCIAGLIVIGIFHFRIYLKCSKKTYVKWQRK